MSHGAAAEEPEGSSPAPLQIPGSVVVQRRGSARVMPACGDACRLSVRR